ncbi:hypothetical protein ID866_7704 [Astraeus odoratus]|nr:hypothetical protein ID866_7704 [Astraeus odoratus]
MTIEERQTSKSPCYLMQMNVLYCMIAMDSSLGKAKTLPLWSHL